MARTLNDRSNRNKQSEVTKLWVRVAAVVALFVLAPPVGIIAALVMGKTILTGLKDQGFIQTNVEGKSSVNWSKAKSSGQKAADNFRSYSRDAAQKYKVHVSESDIMDERLPRKRHSHDPVTYSYGSCSTENRLEQLKDLKNAGILDEVEFQQRKAKLLARR